MSTENNYIIVDDNNNEYNENNNNNNEDNLSKQVAFQDINKKIITDSLLSLPSQVLNSIKQFYNKNNNVIIGTKTIKEPEINNKTNLYNNIDNISFFDHKMNYQHILMFVFLSYVLYRFIK